MRAYSLLALALLVAGCPSYDRYSRVVDEDGLVAADRFAAYGVEQAQAVAIGRAFGSAFTGTTKDQRIRQAAAAVTYAQSLPGVSAAVPDSAGDFVTVTFKSGWKKVVTPIADGVPADRTPGLPAR
jgi:hypothetical protein